MAYKGLDPILPRFWGQDERFHIIVAMIKSAHDEKYKNLLKYLNTAREEQGLTVRMLGERLGEHNQLVSKIESGVRKLSVHEYVQYCDALGVDPLEGIKRLR